LSWSWSWSWSALAGPTSCVTVHHSR
jgi:hypothetical protein